MRFNRFVLHMLVLMLEVGILLSIALLPLYAGTGDRGVLLLHYHVAEAYALTVTGLACCFMACVVGFCASRLEEPSCHRFGVRIMLWSLSILGMLGAVCGIAITVSEYPEIWRNSTIPTAEERLHNFHGVKVSFDVSGGQCSDRVRIVADGSVYGQTMNLYPSEDERYFTDIWAGKINLPRGLLHLAKCNTRNADDYVNYFATNVVSAIAPGEVWTYVVDVEHFSGKIANWFVGQTLPTNMDAYVQFERGRINSAIESGGRYFLCLKSNSWPNSELLDRGVIVVGPGQSFDVAFRVSLFAGTGINESNYHYVRPGETLACPLPVPTKEGYAFEGWFDGDRLITEESKVEKRETHTLKAHWRKL